MHQAFLEFHLDVSTGSWDILLKTRFHSLTYLDQTGGIFRQVFSLQKKWKEAGAAADGAQERCLLFLQGSPVCMEEIKCLSSPTH